MRNALFDVNIVKAKSARLPRREDNFVSSCGGKTALLKEQTCWKRTNLVALFFGKMGKRKNIADRRDEYGMVGKEGFTTVDRAASDGVSDAMTLITDFLELFGHVLVHGNVEA